MRRRSDPTVKVRTDAAGGPGYAENAAVGNGHLEPGMQVLTKPFAMDTLAARVCAIVEAW